MQIQQRTWALTDVGALNFLKDQMTLEQAVKVINQLCMTVNRLQCEVQTVHQKLALPAENATPHQLK
jgi:hypothetical protein